MLSSYTDYSQSERENQRDRLSCHAFKLGISSEQDARTTRLSPLLTLRFKCRTAYLVN